MKPLLKQVPICPVTSCFPSFLPIASLICFLSSESCRLQLWVALGPSCTETTLVSRLYMVPVQWPSSFVLPSHKDCQPLGYRKQTNRKTYCAWWCITRPNLLVASLDLHHITPWSIGTGALTLFCCFFCRFVFPWLYFLTSNKAKQSKNLTNQKYSLLLILRWSVLHSAFLGETLFIEEKHYCIGAMGFCLVWVLMSERGLPSHLWEQSSEIWQLEVGLMGGWCGGCLGLGK